MKILEIKILLSLVTTLKPGLCTDVELIFKSKQLKKNLSEAELTYNECIHELMSSYEIELFEDKDGVRGYNYVNHPAKEAVDEKVLELSKRNYPIESVNISKSDYKVLMANITIEEMEYIDLIFIINNPT